MSEQYRGEGLGFYYTRLQAQREQRQKGPEQRRSADLSTQVGTLTQPDTIDHEVQTEVAESTPPNTDQGAGGTQTGVPSTSEQRVLNQTLDRTEEERIRNVFLGSLVWTRFQQQQAREREIFKPLSKRPVVRRLIPSGQTPLVHNIPVQTPPV